MEIHIGQHELLSKAEAFLQEAYAELGKSELLQERLVRVADEIADTGTWTPDSDELTHGARMAWRNSNRCIGRIYWKSLKVVDARHLDTPEAIFDAMDEHIAYAFNGGQIRSVITVFRAKCDQDESAPRIVNHQLLRFAGYAQPDGNCLGDPAEQEFTRHCMNLGWKGEGTAFDFLPYVLRWPGYPEQWRMPSIPNGVRVPIVHPELDWFESLGLQWYAVPIISEMMLEIGGIQFTAAPFNGWYMGTEIGSRNFGDISRYNMLPAIAIRMGLDMASNHGLWKDRAMVELNRAVIYSFEKTGMRITNHHEAAELFVQFEESERKNGRDLHADWIWITPPMSASITPVYHRLYDNTVKGPNFYYQDPCIGKLRFDITPGCPFHAASLQAAAQKPE